MTPSLWSAPVLACIVTLLLMTPTAAQPGDASAEATWLKPGRDVQWQWQLAGYGDDDPAVSIVPKAQVQDLTVPPFRAVARPAAFVQSFTFKEAFVVNTG